MKKVAFLLAFLFGIAHAHAQVLTNPPPSPGTNAYIYTGCKGVTGDDVALNALISSARTFAQASIVNAASLNLPTGAKCVVNNTLNFTGFTFNNMTVNCNGATLYGFTTGAPIVDALGSTGIIWNDCHIVGDATSEPSYGFQMGRTDITANNGGGSGMVFNQMVVKGSFTVTGFYNFSGEGVTWYSPNFANADLGAGAYSFVEDGFNHFNITSAFVTELAPVDSAQSFTQNIVIHGGFKMTGAGSSNVSSIWWGGGSQHRIDGYVLNTSGANQCVTFYNEATVNNSGAAKDNTFDLHCEGTNITDMYLVSGNVTTPVLQGITIKEGTFFPSNSVLKLGGSVTSASCQACEIDVASVLTAQQSTARTFDAPQNWSAFTGKVSLSLPQMWNQPNGWWGRLELGVNSWLSPDMPGPCDFITCQGAWSSARRLGRAYTGPIINIKNNTSSATADVYPGSDSAVSTSSVAGLLVTGATGNFVTEYDQSGSAIGNLTQSTTASQPALTIQLATLNNRVVTVSSDGSAICMPSSGSTTTTFGSGGYFAGAVNLLVGNTNIDRLYEIGTANFLVITTGTKMLQLNQAASTTNGTWATPAITLGSHVFDMSYNAAANANVPTITVDGAGQTLTSTQPVGTITANTGTLFVGNVTGTAGARGWSGSIADVVFSASIPNSNAQDAVRRNMAGFYGVTGVQ